MATFQSRFGANAIRAGIGWAFSPKKAVDFFACTTTQLATTATVYAMMWIPKNAWILGMLLLAESQLDSNGSPTLGWNVGDSGSAARYMSAITTVGRASGQTSSSTMVAASIGFKTTADTQMLIAVQAVSATPVAGNIRLFVDYLLDETA